MFLGIFGRIWRRRAPAPTPDGKGHWANHPLLAGREYQIEYEDERGRTTVRTVEIREITTTAKGAPVIKAICHKREAPRLFRLDRIKSLVDEHGEIFGPEEFLHAAIAEVQTERAKLRRVRKPRSR